MCFTIFSSSLYLLDLSTVRLVLHNNNNKIFQWTRFFLSFFYFFPLCSSAIFFPFYCKLLILFLDQVNSKHLLFFSFFNTVSSFAYISLLCAHCTISCDLNIVAANIAASIVGCFLPRAARVHKKGLFNRICGIIIIIVSWATKWFLIDVEFSCPKKHYLCVDNMKPLKTAKSRINYPAST